MSSFKKLNQQDVYITSYVAKKSWNTSGINKREEGIYFLPFSKNATVLNCTCRLTATFQSYIDDSTTPTPTPTSTPTPTPVDCALVLSGEHISYII